MPKKSVKAAASETKVSSRRKFLKGGAIAAAGTAAVVAAPNIARAQTTTLKMQGAWGGGIFKEMALDYVSRVNDMSGGSLQIDYLDVGAVVTTGEMQTAVHNGVLDGAHFVTAYWYSKNPAASLFGTGPSWGWTANNLLGWFYYGGGLDLYNELMNDILRINIVGFLSGPMPAQPLGWFQEHITSVEQMQGLKYRTVGLAANVMEEMGLSVVQLPGGEIQPALQTGLIDAAEFNNPTSDRDFGMQDVSKHYHLASFHQAQESFEIVFNKDRFNALADEQQAIVRIAAEAASSDMSWKAQDRYSTDLVALRVEHDVNIYRTEDSIMAAQIDAWDVIVEQFTSVDPFFSRVVDSQKEWAQRVGAYEITNAPDYTSAYTHYFGSPT